MPHTTRTLPSDRRPATDADLYAAVERVLTEYHRRPVQLTSFHRRPCPYRTSAALEEIDVELDDDVRHQILVKDASLEALHEEARRIKPMFLHDPLREIQTYRCVLAGHRL